MNLELIAQLAILALVVASGPLVIALLAAQKGNLWCEQRNNILNINFVYIYIYKIDIQKQGVGKEGDSPYNQM